MKLCYFKARNVLSFGSDDVFLEFDSTKINIIAGPNDSGKTNLFRSLRLIEEAFEYDKPSLNTIFWRGDDSESPYVELGVRLNPTERELLATQIILSEMMRVKAPEQGTEEIRKDPRWERILKNYGSLILSKSLGFLTFVLTKDASRFAPQMFVKIFDGDKTLYMNRNGYLSDVPDQLASTSSLLLVKAIQDDFYNRFKHETEDQINLFLDSHFDLSKDVPSLLELVAGKLNDSPRKVVQLRGDNLDSYRSTFGTDPIIAKFSRLCHDVGIPDQQVYVWRILQQIYKNSLIWVSELRTLQPPQAAGLPQPAGDTTLIQFVGDDLALMLFQLKNSGTLQGRGKYSRIQRKFKDLTESDFDLAVRPKEIPVMPSKELVITPAMQQQSYPLNENSGFSVLGIREGSSSRLVNEAYVQVIKDNFPCPISQSASGLFEILFLLTAIIGENEKVILLDEPEIHLHPSMQKRILALVSESVADNSNQILMITHSPYFVSSALKDSTWRFTKTEKGTRAHNLGQVLLKLDSEEISQIDLRLAEVDIRSLLFSRGVIFVEGLSDKIVVEQVDAYLSRRGNGAGIAENEWSVVDIGGKKSLTRYLKLSEMLGVPCVCIMDYDALMRKEAQLSFNNCTFMTSTIFFALRRVGRLKDAELELLIRKTGVAEQVYGAWYEQGVFDYLQTEALKYGVFVFSTDLEGQIQTPKTDRMSKPLKDLQKLLEWFELDRIPPEFYKVNAFLLDQIKSKGT